MNTRLKERFMPYVDFITRIHTATKRDYLKRVMDHDKAVSAEIAMPIRQGLLGR